MSQGYKVHLLACSTLCPCGLPSAHSSRVEQNEASDLLQSYSLAEAIRFEYRKVQHSHF